MCFVVGTSDLTDFLLRAILESDMQNVYTNQVEGLTTWCQAVAILFVLLIHPRGLVGVSA